MDAELNWLPVGHIALYTEEVSLDWSGVRKR